MENYTKGKWISDIKGWQNSEPTSIAIQLESENHFSGKSIARVEIVDGSDFDRFRYEKEESMANAKLMAKSPQMYEAITEILTMLNSREYKIDLILNGNEALKIEWIKDRLTESIK